MDIRFLNNLLPKIIIICVSTLQSLWSQNPISASSLGRNLTKVETQMNSSKIASRSHSYPTTTNSFISYYNEIGNRLAFIITIKHTHNTNIKEMPQEINQLPEEKTVEKMRWSKGQEARSHISFGCENKPSQTSSVPSDESLIRCTWNKLRWNSIQNTSKL